MNEQLAPLIEYKKVRTTKRNVFSLIKQLALETGWIELASNPKKEGMIFYSKGTDENNEKEIWVQLRENYNASEEYFSTTSQQLFNVRTMLHYEPNITSGINGTHTPSMSNSTMQRVQIGSASNYYMPDDVIDFYYHFTLDRMIFIMTFPRTLESVFVMAGRLSPHYALETKDIGNMSVCSNTNGWGCAVAMGEPNSSRNNGYELSTWTVPLPRSFMTRKTYMSEIGFGSPTEGFKGYLEGIYSLTMENAKQPRLLFDGDKIYDENGNEFTLINCYASYSNLLPNPYYAVCTKINVPEEEEE